MVWHGGSSAGSYLTDPTSPIPSHCASIVVTSTLRVKLISAVGKYAGGNLCSGIVNGSGSVLTLELNTHRRQKFTLLHSFTDLFRKEIFLTLQNKCEVSLSQTYPHKALRKISLPSVITRLTAYFTCVLMSDFQARMVIHAPIVLTLIRHHAKCGQK